VVDVVIGGEDLRFDLALGDIGTGRKEGSVEGAREGGDGFRRGNRIQAIGGGAFYDAADPEIKRTGDRWENGDYIYGKRRLREIDRRIRFLSTRCKRAPPNSIHTIIFGPGGLFRRSRLSPRSRGRRNELLTVLLARVWLTINVPDRGQVASSPPDQSPGVSGSVHRNPGNVGSV
jgi:hypothetical protein